MDSKTAPVAAPPANDSDPATTTAAPQVKLPTDPAVLIAQVRSVFPKLDVNALETIVRAWVAAGEGTGNPSQRDTVVKRLTVLMHVSLADIQKSALAIFQGLNEEMDALKKKFEDQVGGEEDSQGSTFDAFAKRYKAEQDEQDQLTAMANAVLKMVMAVCAALNIPNPDKPTDPKSEGKTKQSALAHALRQKMIDYGMVTSGATSGTAAPSSWTTPPILTEDDPEYQTLLAIHDVVKGSAGGAEEALAQLKIYGIDLDKISQSLVDIVKKARTQLKQSDEIRRNVGKDYEGYAHEVDAVQRMLQILNQVNSYYGTGSPSPAKATSRR